MPNRVARHAKEPAIYVPNHYPSDMDVTDQTFNDEVIQRSYEIPVVVDFWAAWCGPCRQLGPLIESVAARRDGEIVLAKVDIDANPTLAQKYRIQSIPAVRGFRDGEIVGSFDGLIPQPAIEAFFNNIVPSEVDRLIEEGDEDSLREALTRDAGRTDARLALGRILIADGRVDEALEVLKPAAHDHGAQGLMARIRLLQSDTPDIAAGLAALARDDRETALTHLLDAVRTSDGELRDLVRQTMIGIFGELGDQHPLTVKFRRRLAQTLY